VSNRRLWECPTRVGCCRLPHHSDIMVYPHYGESCAIFMNGVPNFCLTYFTSLPRLSLATLEPATQFVLLTETRQSYFGMAEDDYSWGGSLRACTDDYPYNNAWCHNGGRNYVFADGHVKWIRRHYGEGHRGPVVVLRMAQQVARCDCEDREVWIARPSSFRRCSTRLGPEEIATGTWLRAGHHGEEEATSLRPGSRWPRLVQDRDAANGRLAGDMRGDG
jgi:prepilin-type processing-associated H-X9-DG protein